MKKYLLLLIALIPVILWGQTQTQPQAPAQPPKSWVFTGITGLNLNQAHFTNWTAGGTNSVAFSAMGKFTANHTKNKFTWNNNLNLMYGMNKNEHETMKKNEDLIELISVLGHDITKKWAFVFYINFRSQFAKGYDPANNTIVISKFMSPGYLTLSPGFRYKPNDWSYILISPITAKMTFVLDQNLADEGSFGVKPAERDSNGMIIKHGEKVLFYLGPFVEAYMKKEIAKGLTFESRLNIMYTFLNRRHLKAYDADVSWENFLNYSIAKYFSVSLFVQFLYLPGQPAIKFENVNGVSVPNAVYSKDLQIKETLGIGITYKFPEEKK
jgi:hypothetical protein